MGALLFLMLLIVGSWTVVVLLVLSLASASCIAASFFSVSFEMQLVLRGGWASGVASLAGFLRPW